MRLGRSVRVRHSRMLLAGIQAKLGLDRWKHSSVTNSGNVILASCWVTDFTLAKDGLGRLVSNRSGSPKVNHG
jgi:hypothetical protein